MKINEILSNDSLQEVIKKIKHNFNWIKSKFSSVEKDLDKLDTKINNSIEDGNFWLSFDSYRTKNVTDSFLFNDEVATNILPFLIPKRSRLMYVLSMTNGSETWDLQILLNGSVVKTINVNNTGKKVEDISNDDIILNKGDEISVYCKGSNVSKPTVKIIILTE